MKIAIGQINTIIGDIEGNTKKIIEIYSKATKESADIVVFPELSVCGYPPLDFIEKKEFRQRVANANMKLALETKRTALIFGSITEDYDEIGTGVYNSALFCCDGKIQFIQNKTLIPNYDVFDEVRYFESAKENKIFEFEGERLGISVCEDIWNDSDYWKNRRYEVDPIQNLIDKNASLLINISASPYAYGKRQQRREMLSVLTKNDKVKLVYACCVGAQTDLIFDGASMYFDETGRLLFMGKVFEEDYFIVDTEQEYKQIEFVERTFEEEVTDALVLGLKDYSVKSGFNKALVGLSGGIDSAIVTYLAVKAFGRENVFVVLLPSEFSSEGSINDSLKLIKNLGIAHSVISIRDIYKSFLVELSPLFAETNFDITEENLQSRIRGVLLMALSNKFKYLLCTTGNKSEIAVGYATLYGDMSGALAVIGDVYKSDIYRIAKYINHNEDIIPSEILSKEPSAELRPNQTDQDSLPPYDLLDQILKYYLEENKEFEEINKKIQNPELVKKILNLVDRNEFKRKQAAPVLRVSVKAFGYGRRFPIVQNWKR